IVAGHRLAGALEDEEVLLAPQRLDDGGLREGAEDVDVDRADGGIPPLTQMVDRRLDVFGRRSERHEDRLRISGSVLADQSVVPPCQRAKNLVGVLEELQNRLGEI